MKGDNSQYFGSRRSQVKVTGLAVGECALHCLVIEYRLCRILLVIEFVVINVLQQECIMQLMLSETGGNDTSQGCRFWGLLTP